MSHFKSVFFLLLITLSCVNAQAKQPNVLVIITDEHNFRTLGCYRDLLSKDQAEMWGPGAVVETPHLDRLAKEGVICTRAYATAPVCTPSRAAMVTGLYPHSAGAPANNLKLRDDVPTIAKIMNENGYRTGFIGKWHLGGNGKPEWKPKVDGGFQVTDTMFNRGHWKKFQMTENGPRVAAREKDKPNYNVDDADAKSFATDFLTDRAIKFIDSQIDQPFLAFISYPDPHGPNTVRKPYDHMYDQLRFLPPRTYGRKDLAKPGWLAGKSKKHPQFRSEQMSRYFGMVKCIDDNLGRLFKHLQDSKRLDDTIIMMTSDHGDLCYEHDRLNKGNPYEGSARVPMLIRFPSKIPAGSVYRQPVGTVDLTPTVLSLANVATNAKFQGRDLSQQLASKKEPANNEITFLRNAGTSVSWLSAVDQRYKLVLSVNDKPWLLDSEQDPDELLNFFGRPGSKEVCKRLASALNRYLSETNDPYGDHQKIQQSLRQIQDLK